MYEINFIRSRILAQLDMAQKLRSMLGVQIAADYMKRKGWSLESARRVLLLNCGSTNHRDMA